MLETSAPPLAKGRRVRPRAIAGVVGLILLLGACFWVRGLLLRADVANRDFVAYWTTGRLLALHQNPYDQASALQIERSKGTVAGHAMVMRNPPWALLLALPLGWFDAPTAGLFWLIVVIASGLASLQLIRPPGMKSIPLILVFFAPVLICVETEQMSLFVLLGLALFARLEEKRPFAAGLALTLVLLKPHLALVFLMVLALDAVSRRRVRVITGLVVGFAAANFGALAIRHDIWREYLRSMGEERLQDYFYPNVANLCRLLGGRNHVWPLAIPVTVATVWAVWYWWSKGDWDWRAELPLIAAVSVLVAPYSYPYDGVLFWPAVLTAWPRASRPARIVLVVLNLCAIAVTLRASNVGSPVYTWNDPAWMLWCVYVWWRSREPGEDRIAIPEARAARSES